MPAQIFNLDFQSDPLTKIHAANVAKKIAIG